MKNILSVLKETDHAMSDHHVCIHLATSRRNEVFRVEFVSETKTMLSRLTTARRDNVA